MYRSHEEINQESNKLRDDIDPLAVEELGKLSFYFVKERRIFEQARSFLNSLLTVFYYSGPDNSKTTS